jgi:low affinity Fe/Cu permease
MTTTHPVERGGEGRGRFERLAERASNVSSSPAFFLGCGVLVVAWTLSFVLGWPADVRAYLGDMLTAVTLALVALVKNAERRSEHAIQVKLDAIAQALLEAQDGRAGPAVDQLERAIGRHEEV